VAEDGALHVGITRLRLLHLNANDPWPARDRVVDPKRDIPLAPTALCSIAAISVGVFATLVAFRRNTARI
jgi:hypothetical protein